MKSSSLKSLHAAALLIAGTLLSSATLEAQVDFQVRGKGLAAGQALQVGLTDTVEASLTIVNAGGTVPRIQGFQMAITADPAFLDFQSGTWRGTALETAALRNNLGPEFFSLREVAGPPAGLTLGVVFENGTPQIPASFFLLAGEWPVTTLVFRPLQATPTPVRIDFAAALGAPPIANRFSDFDRPTETSLAPATLSGLEVNVGAETAYTIHFQGPQVTVDAGASVTVPVLLQNSPLAVHGFSFGVKHDAVATDLVDATWSASFRALLGSTPDDQAFQFIDKVPAGGAGFTVAAVLSARDGTKVLAAAGSPHHILDVTYRPKIASGTTSVEVTDQLGQPKVEVILDLSGRAQRPRPPATNPPPTVLTVEVQSVTTDQRFIRGDADQNRRVSLTDAIGILRFLFDSSTLPPVFLPTVEKCLVAFNADGSAPSGTEEETDIDLTDGVFILRYLFQGGPKPPEPFGAGNACAVFAGQASERMKCVEFACQ